MQSTPFEVVPQSTMTALKQLKTLKQACTSIGNHLISSDLHRPIVHLKNPPPNIRKKEDKKRVSSHFGFDFDPKALEAVMSPHAPDARYALP